MKVCVPVVERDAAKAAHKVARAQSAGADLVELWLGEIQGVESAAARAGIFKGLAASKKVPIVANCKGPAERGNFPGNERTKVQLLQEAALAFADFVDFDWQSGEQALGDFQANCGQAKLILSAHFWERAPSLPKLLQFANKMLAKGARILKFAVMARDGGELLTLLRLAENLHRKSIPHICLAMGEAGKASRLLVPAIFGGLWTFAPVEKSDANAPGQFCLQQVRQWESLLA